MLVLQASVGKGAQNRKHDVTLVQEVLSAIQVRTQYGMHPLYRGQKDGRVSPALIQAIETIQRDGRFPITGRVDPRSQTLQKMERGLPHNTRLALEKTPATDTGRQALIRKAEAFAKATMEKAPFPNKERRDLAKAIKDIVKVYGVSVDRKRDWVTSDGHFATELKITSVLPMGITERELVPKISLLVSITGSWRPRNTNDLTFTNNRVVGCLIKGSPVSAEDLKLIGLTAIPVDKPVLRSIAEGLASCFHLYRTPDELGILDEVPGVDEYITRNISYASIEELKRRAKIKAKLLGNRSNGCGTATGIASIVPNSIKGVNLLPACNTHDMLYGTLGLPREKADRIFIEDMLANCDRSKRSGSSWHGRLYAAINDRMCRSISWVYYFGVRLFGDGPYEDAQRAASDREDSR